MTVKVLPSAHHIDWLHEVARTTAASGQHRVAARFREIAKALSTAETLNTVTVESIQAELAEHVEKGTVQ